MGGEGWEICPITLLKLQQSWVICTEKGGPNNFAQVTPILDSLYWKHGLLIKNVNIIHENEVFLGINVNFIMMFLRGVWQMITIYAKKYSVGFDQQYNKLK